ncbi:MAG: PaREP1 family protein [Desulfurococcales archaeon]|nr:PaREP1 family protein [Desulfurococcales archaeon]
MRLGISIEEYFLELISQGMDPKERSIGYIEASSELVEQAEKELRSGNVRQAAEKVWGAAALAVKAYAYWKENRRLASHGELWGYVEVVANDIGEWVRSAWNEAAGMHICFYEGWCKPKQVQSALKHVEELVKEIESRIKR